MDLSLEDKKEENSHDKSDVAEKPDDPKEDVEIEDNANEEPFVRKETSPLTEKEETTAADDSALDEEVLEEQTAEPQKETEEAAVENASAEKEAEPEVTSGRRSTRRSNAAPAKQATPKATPRNAKKTKGTLAPDAQDTDEKEVEEKAEDEKDESKAATPARRNLRTPKSEAKPAKTPPSKAIIKQEDDTKEVNAEASEEPTPNRRRSTRAVVVKKEEVAKATPAKTIKKEPEEAAKPSAKGGRGKKRAAAEDNNESAETPTAKAPAKKAKKEEDEEVEAPATKATPRRASARSKSAAATPSTASKSKVTPKSAKKTPKEGPEDVEMESEEDGDQQEQGEEEVAPKKTPKRAPPKRGSATEKRAPKQRKRRASEAPADPSDPYNFDTKKNEAPVLFKSVQVERQSYGNMKFFKASDSGSPSKYASMEKNATERRSLMPEQSATSTPGSSKGGRTPASKKTPASTKRGKQAKKAEVEETDEAKEEEKPTPKPKTPKAEAVAKPPKVQEQAPVLTAEEQITADDESNAHFQKGARVFAIWGKEYYSAIVDDLDGLGRYKVFYTEDQSVRNVPKAGIIPLHLVTEGSHVSVLGEKDEDGEKPIFNGKVVAIPSIKNPEEWYAGIYSIEVTNEEHPEPETKDIKWFDIYFTEPQFKQTMKKIKNPTAVDEGNVIDSGRRTRRSTTAAAAAATPTTANTTPRAKPGPKAGAKKAKKVEENEGEAQEEEQQQQQEQEEESTEDKFFDKIQFILTSANRSSGPPPFTKKEVRKQIETHGGTVIENFQSRDPALTTYLIADTFYRTHKYLTALSLSLPTISYTWIDKCIEEKQLVDIEDFMLDAGDDEATGEVFKWQDIRGKILVGKKVAVYSRHTGSRNNNAMDFVNIWAPIAFNLGAELVEFTKENVKEVLRAPGSSDYFIADDGTTQSVINAAYEGGGIAVSSEWCIQTVIKGYIAPTTGNESYILKAK